MASKSLANLVFRTQRRVQLCAQCAARTSRIPHSLLPPSTRHVSIAAERQNDSKPDVIVEKDRVPAEDLNIRSPEDAKRAFHTPVAPGRKAPASSKPTPRDHARSSVDRFYVDEDLGTEPLPISDRLAVHLEETNISASKTGYSPSYSPLRTPPPPLSFISQLGPPIQGGIAADDMISTIRQHMLDHVTLPEATRPPVPAHLLENLPFLLSQPPFYAQISIHGKPYLVTSGDSIRLPFLMYGVSPGDTLRLDRASILGSREWSMKAGPPLSDVLESQKLTVTEPVIGKTADLVEGAASEHQPKRAPPQSQQDFRSRKSYLDDRLFVIRATVLGTESEPMRIKEKTKRRNRKVRTVRSKHKYTVLRISEISIKTKGQLEMEGAVAEAESK